MSQPTAVPQPTKLDHDAIENQTVDPSLLRQVAGDLRSPAKILGLADNRDAVKNQQLPESRKAGLQHAVPFNNYGDQQGGVKFDLPKKEELREMTGMEWHDELGPPYLAAWKGRMPPTESGCCCNCWPEDDNDIMTKHRMETRPNFSRGKRQYDEFYGAPIIAGKYSHDFSGKKVNRPSGIKNNLVQPPHQNQQQMLMQQQQQQMMMMQQQQQQQQMMTMNPSALQQQPPTATPQPTETTITTNPSSSSSHMEQEMKPIFSPEVSKQQQQQQQGQQPKKVTSEPITTPNSESKQNQSVAESRAAQQQQQQQQQGQQPQQMSEAQKQYLHGFAKFIGIDVEKEPQLIPLAQQCLATPPPQPWVPVKDQSSGRMYYANTQTKETSWDHPMLPMFKERVIQWRQHYEQQKVAAASSTSTNPLSKDGAKASNNNNYNEEGAAAVRGSSGNNNQDASSDPHRVPSPSK